MATSAYPKTNAIIRNVATAQKAATVAGQNVEIRLPLNRDTLTVEQQVTITVNATGAAALATPPTDLLMHVAQVVDSISIETDKGSLIIGDGQSIVAISSFTENQPTPKFNDIGGFLSLTFDLHHENDSALHDLITAVETGILSKNDIVVRFKDPFAAGVFAAGATPSLPIYDVRVNAELLPDLEGRGSVDLVEDVDTETGEVYELPNPHFGVASMSHHIRTQTIKPTGAGRTNFIMMSAGSALRFASLMSIDNITGLPVDNALGQVSLVVNGQEIRSMMFDEIQASNQSKRAFSHAGVAIVDFGDDEDGFLDLSDVSEARLFVEVLTTAPAALDVRLCEDYTAGV